MIRTKQNAAIAAGAHEIPAIYAEGADGRAVLMAHGLMGDKNEYKDTLALLADRLEAAGAASLRIDFRGHGDSARPLAEFTLASQIQDLAAAARWLLERGHSELTLLGYSFGAPPVLALASLYPEAVRRCVLLSPVTDYRRSFVEPNAPWNREHFGRERLLAGIREGGLRLEENYTLSPAVLTDMLLCDIPALARAATCPITIFHGDSDRYVAHADSEALCRLGDHIRLRTMPQTGHGPTDFDTDSMESEIALKNLEDVAAVLGDVPQA